MRQNKLITIALVLTVLIAGYFIFKSMNTLGDGTVTAAETMENLSPEGKQMHEDYEREKANIRALVEQERKAIEEQQKAFEKGTGLVE
jgi:hypothetical protein